MTWSLRPGLRPMRCRPSGRGRFGRDDCGAGDEDSCIGHEDGMAEQLVGWSHCPALAYSDRGYVG